MNKKVLRTKIASWMVFLSFSHEIIFRSNFGRSTKVGIIPIRIRTDHWRKLLNFMLIFIAMWLIRYFRIYMTCNYVFIRGGVNEAYGI